MPHSSGLHHITALAGNPQQNYNFYNGLLGLHLIKKTVNYDDPSMYHLYYGDATGTPGRILTFFPWSQFKQGDPARGQAIAISFSIPTDSISYWTDYLTNRSIEFVEPYERFGHRVIGLQDPDGLHLELVADPQANNISAQIIRGIPAEHAIHGLYGITLAEENYRPTGQLLSESLGFEEKDRDGDRLLYQSDSQMGSVVEIIDEAKLDGQPGKGTVHHIAFRAENEEHQSRISKALTEIGYHLTEVKDRTYFRSVYFRGPGGILFEIATDGPGFGVDEESDKLGSTLCLPPSLESKRSLVDAELPEIT
jgi:glyoxalase family protein